MRTQRSLFVLTVAGAIALLSAEAQNLTLDRRAFILSKTYASIPIHFAHWQAASFQLEQLDSIYQVFLKRGLETENRKEFALLMREFIALLQNGHSWYNDNKIFGASLPMGFSCMTIDGKWVVTRSVIEDVLPGDCIIRINGTSLDEYFNKLSRYISASDVRAGQARLIWTLGAMLPNLYSMEIETKSGEVRQLSVDRSALTNTPQHQRTESRWIERDKIAYLKVPSFNRPEFENSALQQLTQFGNAPALIVDVRGNGGGSTPGRLTSALMDRPYRWWTEGTPLTIGLFRYYSEARPSIELNEYFRNAQLTWQSATTKPAPAAFSGTLIILIDRNTGSAAEDFVVPFKDNGRATIIGEATNGSTGQPFMYDFGDGIGVGIGTKRAYMPNGGAFEGVGIVPDIEIAASRADLYEGEDRALVRAITAVRSLR